MADIHIEREHNLDFATARSYAKAWLQKANDKFDLSVAYQEGDNQDTVKIQKSGVDATATLTAEKIIFEAELSFLAKPLKGMITSGVEDGLDKFFGKKA